MWNLRKPCVIAVILTALYYRVAAVKKLDMALNAVDDMYDKCHEEAMAKLIHSGLLQKEQEANEAFKNAWKTTCKKSEPGLKEEHINALHIVDKSKFWETFNDAVEMFGTNASTYTESFKFKSLHFLLMDSIRLLNPKGCIDTYFISDKKYDVKKGAKVRFGRFTAAHSDLTLIEDKEETYFKINTCYFADLQNLCLSQSDLVLLSPSEEFTVEDYIPANAHQYNEITLKHSQMHALQNCYIQSRSSADVPTQWVVTALATVFLVLFH